MQVADNEAIRQTKVELAATCRWAARLGMQSGVCNHFSVAVPGRPDLMLINPEGYFWSEVSVGSLVMATHDGTVVSQNGNSVELTAFCIHAPIHRLLPHATAVLHTHMHHATAICTRAGGIVADLSGGYLQDAAAGGGWRSAAGADPQPAARRRQYRGRAALHRLWQDADDCGDPQADARGAGFPELTGRGTVRHLPGGRR
jgi:hypothetical protein